MRLALAGLLALPFLPAPQDADPVAWLPGDAVAYVRVANVQAAQEFQDQYTQRFFREEAAREMRQRIQEWSQRMMGDMPEALRRRLTETPEGVRAIHLAVTLRRPNDPEGYILLVCENEQALHDLTADWLDETLVEAEPIDGVPTYYRPAAENAPAPELHAALAGSVGILAFSREGLAEVLDRRAGRRTDAITTSDAYRALGPVDANFDIRYFCDFQRLLAGAFGTSRYDRWQFEEMDGVLGVRALRSLSGRAWFADGQIHGRSELVLDPSSTLLALLRQPAGDGRLWEWVPDSALFGAVLGTGDIQGLHDRIRDMVNAIDRTESRTPGSSWADFTNETRRALGVAPEELIRGVGAEAAMFVVVDDTEAFNRRAEGMTFLVRLRDDQESRDLVERIAQSEELTNEYGGWASETYQGEMIRATQSEMSLAYALVGDVLVMGSGRIGVERAIDAHAGRGARLYAPEGGHDGNGSPSKTFAINWHEILRVAEASNDGNTDLPFTAEDLQPGAMDVGFTWETENRLITESHGSGITSSGVLTVPLLPLMFFAIREVASSSYMREQYRAMGIEEPDWDLPAPAPPPAAVELPADPAQRAAAIESWVRDLGADDPTARERATMRLAAAGEPAFEPLSRALHETQDPEVRARAERILMESGAYTRMPDIMDATVERFLDRLGRVSGTDPTVHGWELFEWPVDYGEGEYYMEPKHNGWFLHEAAILTEDEARRRAGERLLVDPLQGTARQNLVGFLILYGVGPAEESLVQAVPREADRKTKALMYVALGWCRGEEARRLILGGLRSGDAFIRRASFIAAEHFGGPEMVEAMVDLLGARDRETRFNAAYTLRAITGGRYDVRAFDAEDALRESAARIYDEWKPGRAQFSFTPPDPLNVSWGAGTSWTTARHTDISGEMEGGMEIEPMPPDGTAPMPPPVPVPMPPDGR